MATDEIGSLREELAQLRAQVRELSDRQAIRDCLHRFSKGLDRLDKDLIVSAFHPDAVDHHGAFFGGREEFAAWVDNLLGNEWDSSLHLLDVNNVRIDGDTARSECYVLFSQRRIDGEGIDFGGARYLDELTRVDGEWRISKRKLVIDWTGRAPAMVFADIPEYQTGTRGHEDPSYHPLVLTPPGS
ncbi:MAG TPA: nuclear transport factor 2 family protein [Solirubrobacteraceae bacterium]|nr:nuclear transport factor 2 family protein [Solirubrobacteraceae bacterium]